MLPILALVAALPLASAIYGGSRVTEIGSLNFNERILKSKRAALVEFYSPGCGHCRNLTPIWKKLAENMADHVTIAAINCQEANDLCQRYRISGVPALKVFGISEADDKRYVLDYDGPRELKPLVEYAKRHASSFLYTIKESVSAAEKAKHKRTVTLAEFLEKGSNLPRAILFKSGGSAAASIGMKSLSSKYFGKFVIGQVLVAKCETIAEKYSVPVNKDSFLLIPPTSASVKTVIHEGPLTFSALSEFMEKYATVKDWEKIDL